MSDLWIVAWSGDEIPERFDVFESKEKALIRRDLIVMRNSTDPQLEVYVAQMDKNETAYGDDEFEDFTGWDRINLERFDKPEKGGV